MILRTIGEDSIVTKSLLYIGLIINLLQIVTLPLALAWTCQILSLVPLFYSIDFINACILAVSTLLQYKDEFGTLIDSPKDTFRMMIRKGGALQLIFLFPWDVIPLAIASSQGSCVPYDQTYRIWGYLRALKIIPVLHSLIKASFDIAIPYLSVQVGRLIKAIIGLLILVHMSACFFFSLSISQEPQSNSWAYQVVIDGIGATSMEDQYVHSIYYAMGVFVFNTRDCVTDIEWIYSIFELFIAAIIYGAFFGMINSILKVSTSNESVYRKKEFKFRYKQIQTYMCDNHFPKELQDNIARHEKIKFHHLDGIDEKMVWKNLPKDLHQAVVNFLYGDILKSIAIFQDIDPGFISALALCIEPLHVACDTYVFKVGDEARDMYIVLKGEVEITTPSIFNDENTVRTCRRGDYIGDVALIRRDVREVSARTIVNTDLGRITGKNLDVLLVRFPDAREKVLAKVEEKIRETISASMESSIRPSLTRKNTFQRILSFGKK
jgi:CRP-like cAMP-binding protein